MLHRSLMLLVAAISGLSTPTPGQDGGCNNLTRSLAQPSAVTGAAPPQTCGTLAVSVAGVGYGPPAECPVAYTHYLESVYTCGPVATGIDCDPQGSQASLKVYQNGSCPNLTGLTDGMQWDAWDSVPENLVAIIEGMSQCVPPSVTETFDDSARCTRCSLVGGHQTVVMHSGFDPSGHEYIQAFEDPRLQAAGIPGANIFETPRSAAMKAAAGTTLPLLAQVDSAFPPLAGAQFDISLTMEHYDDGDTEPNTSRSLMYSGRMAVDGTFDLVQSTVATRGAERLPRHHRLLFDGATLVTHTRGSIDGSAYTPEYLAAVPQLLRSELLPHLQPLYRWINNPFQISRFPQHTYSSEDSSFGVMLRKQALSDGEVFVDREILVGTPAGGVPRVLSTQVLDPVGRVMEATTFSRFQELTPGVSRPLRIEHVVYYDRLPTGRRVSWSYRIDAATPLSAADAEAVSAAALDDEIIWTVWH